MRVLIVEDDQPLSDLLSRCLKEESYAIDIAMDGQEAEWMAFENPYDLILLDLMLPRKDGFSVLQAIRGAHIKTPVLVLTAKDETEQIVKLLDAGADDYLTKPFSLEEMLARIRALLRRKEFFSQAILEVGRLKLDPGRKEVTVDNALVNLTTKEFALLEYFMRNPGTVLSRIQLSEHVWDVNFEPSSNVIDVYVGYLRSKLDKALGVSAIRTVRGYGYILDPEPQAITSTIPASMVQNA